VVGALQNAIRDVRALAMNLRPVTLDEFGLLKTLEGVVADIGDFYPELEISLQTPVKEQQIPRPLRIVIYRIVNDMLTGIASRTDADRVTVKIDVRDGTIDLALCENASIYRAGGVAEGPLADAVGLMKERTLLSGGDFEICPAEATGNCLAARWPAQP
jgi:signal transduction histidine kinase